MDAPEPAVDESKWKHLASFARRHPSLAAGIVAFGLLIWLADRKPDFVSAIASHLATSFGVLPSGWVVAAIIFLVIRQFALAGDVKRCHDERVADRSTWLIEKAQLEAEVETKTRDAENAAEQAAEARDAVTDLYERMRQSRDSSPAERRKETKTVEVERRQGQRRKTRKPKT